MDTGGSRDAPGRLGARVAASARWVTGATLVGSATTWLATIALARVLERSEYGLAALAMVAVAIFQLFQDSGLHAALIQRRERIEAAADTAALYAPLTGAGLALLCVAAAPLAGLFFHKPAVEPLVRGLGAVFVLRSFAIVPSALIQRELLFARQAVISGVSSLLYLGSAFALALAGAGAWSVVGGQLVVSSWLAVASWLATPYRPNPLRASRSELRALLGYGRHIVAGNVVGFVNSYTDPTAVGRVYGTVPLGAYTIGFQTGSQAVTIVTGIANQLVFPAYAKLQHDLARFRHAYVRSLRFVCTISPPVAFGLAAISGVLVPALYGPRWNAAVPVLALISFYGLVLSVSATTGEVFKAAGRPDLFFRMGVFQVVLLFAMIGGLYRFGIVGFAGARAGATLVMSVVALLGAGRLLELPARTWLSALREPFLAGFAMGGAVLASRYALAAAYGTRGWQLVPLVAEGALLYPLLLRVLGPARWAEFRADLERIVPLARAVRRLRPGARTQEEGALDEGRGPVAGAVPTVAPGLQSDPKADRQEVPAR